MTPKRIPERGGTGWGITSMAAAGAAVVVVSMITYDGRTWFGEWLGLAASGLLILIGLFSGLAAMWRSRCSRMSMTALIANVLAVVMLCLWWVWPTQRSFINAVKQGDVATARFALQTGVSVETLEVWGMGVRIPGYSPLAIAALNGDAEMVRMLLEWGAEVNRAEGHGNYPLFSAAWSGDLPTIQLLRQADADPAAIGREGSALHIAAAMGHLEVIDLLLAAGVPLDLADRTGVTPLDSARTSRNAVAIENLIQRGAQD